MRKINELKYAYIVVVIFVLVVCVIGSTYAYLTSSTSSSNDIETGSTGYNVSMNITPVYTDFALIPMDDADALKAIKNECKDKYDHGACNLYNINVYGYDSSIDAISGSINTTLYDIANLSYMVLEEVSYNIDNNDDCVSINSKNYCVGKEATHVVANTDMSLGDGYNVFGFTNKNLLLAIWVTNLNQNQNSTDIGSYNSVVTIFLGGDGGQVSGSINGTIENYEGLQGGE